jgi:RNA polymerase sigma-70 factor (ECF subfamily)
MSAPQRDQEPTPDHQGSGGTARGHGGAASPGLVADVARLAAGDLEALQRLIVRYHAALRATLVGAMSEALRAQLEPDDVLQEAYAAAVRGLPGNHFDSPAALYGWLETIVRNELHDAERGLRRQRRNIGRRAPPWTGSSPDLFAKLAGPDLTPSRTLRKDEAVAAVLSSLARLSPDQRAVVRLRFLEDVPVPEIAARLDKSEDAVYQLCHRGLTALRELLGAVTRSLSRG